MTDDGFIEVWFMWNDGERGRAKVMTMPTFYLGRRKSYRAGGDYEFCDVTNSPHLAKMKAMADLVGESELSKKHTGIMWSETFTIPVEWPDAWRDDLEKKGEDHGA